VEFSSLIRLSIGCNGLARDQIEADF